MSMKPARDVLADRITGWAGEGSVYDYVDRLMTDLYDAGYLIALSRDPEAEAMNALWMICWQTGHGCELRIVGSHLNSERVTVGPHTFEGNWSDIAPRLVAWAELLSHRKPNQPLPEPPA